MSKNNKFLQFIKRPRGFFLALIYLLTVAAIVASVVLVVLSDNGDGTLSVAAYALFGVAALLLAYSVYTLVIYAPLIKQKTVEKLKNFRFTAALIENYGFRTAVFAVVSFVVTVAFAAINLVSAIKYRIFWYGAIAAYYVMLVLFRGGVLLADRKCKSKFSDRPQAYERCKLQIYFSSGVFLAVVEIAFAVVVTEMMLSHRPLQGGMIMAIANAAYAFYKMAMAIHNIVRAKRFDNPVVQSLRNLNLADACMSMVSLTVLLISTFGGDGEPDVSMDYVKCTVGLVACVVVVALAAVMIVRACKKLKNLQSDCGSDGQEAAILETDEQSTKK